LFWTSSRATAVLSAACRSCNESLICARASSSCPVLASSKMRLAASQNCASWLARYWRCSGRLPGERDLALAFQCLVEIRANAIEL
jgi:hypothetical protein